MKVLSVALVVVLAGCTAPDPGDDGPDVPVERSDGAGARPVLASFGVDIAPYDPNTGLAGDILFSESLVYDDGRVYSDRPFVEFGWTHAYYDMANIEYWFYTPLDTPVRAPVSGQVSIQYLDHTGDWAIHFDAVPGWTVSFEHVVDMVVEDGDRVEAGDIVAEAAPRPGFGDDLALVELAVWQGGDGITKYCPGDFLDPGLQDEYAIKFSRLADDWDEYIGEEVYDQDAWVSPGCLVRDIQEA